MTTIVRMAMFLVNGKLRLCAECHRLAKSENLVESSYKLRGKISCDVCTK